MADRRKIGTKDKWKEKTWYTIVAPSFLGEREIALSPAADPSLMIGRKVEVPVSDFTGNFRKSSTMVIFRVKECTGKRCTTEFIGHKVSDDTIRRMVRRRKERIDIIMPSKTKDGYRLVIKIVLVSDSKLTANKRGEVRSKIIGFINERCGSMTLPELAQYIIGDNVYNDIVDTLKDVYPIKKIEIRKSEVLGRDGYVEEPGAQTQIEAQ
ncbi:30S ribosomal protein S3ae [Picrophilus oshimae]|uniref:Small ribosomal subunit protein eS1 n=2 Tax=Picrophilus torridus (strain ATCC 700027 / DSM 9790 / JCM 10055 / NBRC 100828 / KAW 2/3) TaxID=1122961 RepID=RS3A_PICTO|nr:30S ribosomal protein S3ae [Picrophilus oshimae]Q6KYU3.1 RecName: Full=Small ribosomal subunit protein eS1; AltName: Full=30S ribosomal protein S3Ae; AltName: Full=Ribosomal protein S1e [Picrophilus oshimae DSM 9789]AAT44109.1 small subunit ribosomal protein S3AE [Picrophilus oshimae DSM 9789]SMD30822.1 SSU ribosomal protein S3AE [Picrophilus oshimae DSM 9789]